MQGGRVEKEVGGEALPHWGMMHVSGARKGRERSVEAEALPGRGVMVMREPVWRKDGIDRENHTALAEQHKNQKTGGLGQGARSLHGMRGRGRSRLGAVI